MLGFLLALLFLWPPGGVLGAEDGFMHSATLDPYGHFVLHWYFNQESVVFKLEVATTGYVGFGISPNGGMAGSDIVTGWVANGHVFVQDRYATGRSMPELDRQQDWKLVRGHENGTHTVLELRRKIDTCDPQDFPITTKSTARVIYAYHPVDPQARDSLSYHEAKRRGSKSLLILQPKVWRDMPSDVMIWDAVVDKFQVPAVDTFYLCKVFKFPKTGTKFHTIKLEPVIQEGNELLVQHMALYQCGDDNDVLDNFVQTNNGHECYSADRPTVFKRCNGMYAVWAIGGETLVPPEHAGLPLGEFDTTYFMMEVHYDNPSMQAGMVDSSGMRFIYTSKLRKYDAATVMVGADLFPTSMVPPGQSRFILPGHCDPACSAPAMGPDGIRVTGYYLHAHSMAKKLRLRHFRNGTELEPISDDKYYDFAYEEYHYLAQEKVVLPGDHLTLECYYDSSAREKTTLTGLATEDEMCVTGLYYYPKMPRTWCVSHPLVSTLMSLTGVEKLVMDHLDLDQPEKFSIEKPERYSGEGFLQHLIDYPVDPEFAAVVQGATRYGPHKQICLYVGGESVEIPTAVTYPKIERRIKEKRLCHVPTEEEETTSWTSPNIWD